MNPRPQFVCTTRMRSAIGSKPAHWPEYSDQAQQRRIRFAGDVIVRGRCALPGGRIVGAAVGGADAHGPREDVGHGQLDVGQLPGDLGQWYAVVLAPVDGAPVAGGKLGIFGKFEVVSGRRVGGFFGGDAYRQASDWFIVRASRSVPVRTEDQVRNDEQLTIGERRT